jgi:hypothetical protein
MSALRMTVHWPDVPPRVLLDGPRTLVVHVTGVGLVHTTGSGWRLVPGALRLPVRLFGAGEASVVRTFGIDGLRRHVLTVAADQRLAVPIVPVLRDDRVTPRRRSLRVRRALPAPPPAWHVAPAVVHPRRVDVRRLGAFVTAIRVPSFLAPGRVHIAAQRVVLALPGRVPREVLRTPRHPAARLEEPRP